MTDTETLDAIHRAMDGNEWDSDLWDVVADLILETGRPAFAPPDPEVTA